MRPLLRARPYLSFCKSERVQPRPFQMELQANRSADELRQVLSVTPANQAVHRVPVERVCFREPEAGFIHHGDPQDTVGGVRIHAQVGGGAAQGAGSNFRDHARLSLWQAP